MHPHRITRSIARWCIVFRPSLFVVFYLVLLSRFSGCASVREQGCDEILSVASSKPEQSRVQYSKGLRLFDHGKLPGASDAFKKAIDLDFENGAAHNNLGLVFYQQRKWPEAAAEFEIASQLMPEDATPWNNLGMTMESTGKGYEAIECYQQAYELAPRKPLYLGNLVRTRIRLGENDVSVREQLIELLTIENRPDWIEWINDQLTLQLNPQLDRGPIPPNLNSANKSKSKTKSNGSLDRTNRSVVPIPLEPKELILADPLSM
jgi:tetratricopeptide (TPR) repeat protein